MSRRPLAEKTEATKHLVVSKGFDGSFVIEDSISFLCEITLSFFLF